MICQFCGKQVSDNEKICRYCGSNLKMPASGAAEPKGGAYSGDETIVMPSRTKTTRKTTPSGFENSRAVQRSVNADVKRPSEHRTEQKRQYYRYNPNAETNRRAGRRPSPGDRRSAPRYSKTPKGKHSVLKWIGRIILLAIVGIAVGILIYLGVNGITNAVKSIGNHENAPASVSTPAPKKTEKNSTSESSVNNENSKQNVKTEDTLNEEKSRTEEKSSSTSENKNNSSQNSKNEERRPAAGESDSGESEGSSNSERTDSEKNRTSGSESNSNSSTNESESGSGDDALEN